MKTTLLALALAAAPFAASAATPLSYTYVEGGFNQLYLDETHASGAYLNGSYDIGSGFNAIASIKRVENAEFVGTSHFDERITQSELGLGYHTPIGASADFIAELAWARFDLSADLDNANVVDGQGTGGRGAIGIRGSITDKVEGLLKANYYDGNDFEGTWTGSVGAQFNINPTWGITAEIEHGDFADDLEATRYQIGVRASF